MPNSYGYKTSAESDSKASSGSDSQASSESGEQTTSDSGTQRPSFNGGPPSSGGSGMPTQPGGFGSLKTLAGYGVCLLIMIGALIFAKLFKRRR